jgi:hypothetical protein
MNPTKLAARERRVKQCNDLLFVIGQNGRQFFFYAGTISKLELDDRHRVWFIDSYSKKRIYTHYKYTWRGFTNGGTLHDLICAMRDYIVTGAEKARSRIQRMLGPWPDYVCGGDLWGYGESMENVRSSFSVLFLEVSSHD